MTEQEQFALVLQRMRLIAETEHSSELDSNALIIFEKLSSTEKLILMKRFIKTHFQVTAKVVFDEGDSVIRKSVSEERRDILDGDKEERSNFKTFIYKTTVVVSMVIMGIGVLIGTNSVRGIFNFITNLIKIAA